MLNYALTYANMHGVGLTLPPIYIKSLHFTAYLENSLLSICLLRVTIFRERINGQYNYDNYIIGNYDSNIP